MHTFILVPEVVSTLSIQISAREIYTKREKSDLSPLSGQGDSGSFVRAMALGSPAPAGKMATLACPARPGSHACKTTPRWPGAKAVPYSCRRPTAASTPTSCANCRAWRDQPGPVLAVEYKGANGWLNAQDDRLIGGLWANLSDGRCRFVMVTDKRWEGIEEQLK